MQPETIRLLIACPDARGIIAAVAGFVARHDGNILDADQHSDPGAPGHGGFFMRVEIERAGFALDAASFEPAWRETAARFSMRWHISWGGRKRMAIFVSRASHCLTDLLWRWRNGELAADIAFVMGNHDDLRRDVESQNLPFFHLPVQAGSRASQEAEVRQLLESHGVECIVLARYMQILSPAFVTAYRERIINIHHSFLPAFAGARPYHQAWERGVKIIGATSHYVTDDLDEGPIIAQETMAVDHRDAVEDMVRKGRDLERIVLARAVRYHLEDRILVSNNKTIVFD